MKKKINRYKICFILMAAFMILFSQAVTAQDAAVEKQLEKLKNKLNLSEEQTIAARVILLEAEVQKAKDRETHKGDALALIHAALERQKSVHDKIELILKEEQLEEFQKIKKPHPVDRELFILTEGLLLNDEQAFDVEGILIEWHNKFGQMGDMMAEGVPPGGGGMRPGGGRMGSPIGRGGGPAGMMKEMEAKKAREIKKILTDEQIELYEQIRKDRREKMKQRIKEMKERFKDKE